MDGRGEVVSSASNNYSDGACKMSLCLIIELPDVAEDKEHVLNRRTKINLLKFVIGS